MIAKRLVHFACCHSFMRMEGIDLWLLLITRPDLHRRGDEGRRVLVGLGIEVHLRWPLVQDWRDPEWRWNWRWRWPGHFFTWSDWRTIRNRIACSAGQHP